MLGCTGKKDIKFGINRFETSISLLVIVCLFKDQLSLMLYCYIGDLDLSQLFLHLVILLLNI